MKALLSCALALLACGRSDSPLSDPDAAASAALPIPAALLPADGKTHAPSAATLPEQGEVDGEYLADVDSCGGCHPDVLAQQQASAHAFASFNNPIYRFAVERLRSEVSRSASRTCAGCHDAALLVDGAMDDEVSPTDTRAHNGVSCRLCHGIESATRVGNGSYALGASPLPLPVTGDATSLAKHKAAARPPALASLCGSCHQSFLSTATGNREFLAGQNELLAWADSAYAAAGTSRVDSVAAKTCVQCHMAKVAAPMSDAAADEQGQVSSHYFLGAHTWLAAMRKDAQHLARARDFLEGVATIDAISSPIVMAEDSRSGEVVIDIVIRNTGVGHRFPSGVRDAANTWVEVEVLGSNGKVIMQAKAGPSAHRLSAYLADEEGHLMQERETHRFAALVADHTIAPRDVALTRYRGSFATARAPKTIRARLLHQSRGAALVAASCAEFRSERGRAYASASRALERDEVNPCIAPPITTIAEVTRVLGDRGESDFTRSYEHGLGLLHEVQERVDSARPSLEAARALAAGNPEQEAMALAALATLDGRLGRADEAVAGFLKVQGLAPKSAAAYAGQGDALSRVWRWPAAADAYAKAIKLASGNASLWRRYAVALGSTGSQREALQAAQQGLRLLPRDADLLRVQALALRSLESGEAERAMNAYLEHRGPDNVGAIRLRCIKASAKCALESMPVHEHRLQTMPPR